MLEEIVKKNYQKGLRECTNEEIYQSLMEMVKGLAEKRVKKEPEKRKLYYISAEFLIGRLMINNLINLGIYDEIKHQLEENGKSLSEIEELEIEPSLGNGGLGRLAACFLDSIASLGLQGDGIGLNYHYGLFKQEFVDNQQTELSNPWIENSNWLIRRENSYDVPCKGFTMKSQLYDIAVTGYDNRVNHLHLFDLDSIDESIVKVGISFDKEDIQRNLTLFLYPDDSDKNGELLRIYQQYFMVCNAAQLIMEECRERGSNLYDLFEYAVIQINDTHPTLIIPELIHRLMKEGIGLEEAITIVSKICVYTNHTILAEALEKWPLSYLKKVVPHLVPIIKILDEKVRDRYKDSHTYIIDSKRRVHMAHIDIHYCYSVNGVAHLHTEILKTNELEAFFRIYPEKFNNKTNGITFRRWLLSCNEPLTEFINGQIGDKYLKDAFELENLLNLKGNVPVLEELLEIKQKSKTALKDYLYKAQGIELNDQSIYDIQIKRLHEYKRQQMNALYIIYKYLEIKKGARPERPITIIFGAKAAPAYILAKDIIHLILCLQELIQNDSEVSPYLKVVMVENYNVTLAEKLIPACDVSEQISLASKEASGTGNMKLMLNGAVTLGTLDGANVEIAQLVGMENIYIFGESSEKVMKHYKKKDYIAKDYYEKDKKIKELVDFIVSDKLLAIGQEENLKRLHRELIEKDWFMTLLDLNEYIEVKEQVFKSYENRISWARKMLVNISKAGYFSSDRTISEYNEDIWQLQM